MMNKKRIYSIIYLICLILLVNSLPFGLLIKNENILFVINLIIKIASIIYILFYIKKEELNKIETQKLTSSSLRLIPLLLLCFSNFIVVLFQQSSFITEIDIFAIISGLIIAVGTGIIEELLFRSQVLEEFLKKKSPFKAILYSSLIFGSVHLLNISSLGSIPTILVQVVYTFFLGLVLGFVYINTKNIIIPITFHILFNFVNDILVINLFEIEWNLIFFIVNILIGALLTIYIGLLIFKTPKGDERNVTENMDI